MSLELPSGLTVLAWLGRSSVQAAVLAALVLVVQALLRRQLTPAWRYRLWLLVVLRLVWPFSAESPFSVFNLFPVPASRPALASPSVSSRATPEHPASTLPSGLTHALPPVASGPPAGESPRRRTPPPTADSEAGRAPAPAPPAPPTSLPFPASPAASTPAMAEVAAAPGADRNRSGAWAWLLAGLWLAGVGSLAGRLAWVNLRFARQLHRDRTAAPERLRRLFEACRLELDVRGTVRVFETNRVRSPALYGLLRPQLLFPRGLANRFSDAELRHVLLHELGHVRRRDLPVNWLVAALQTFHWFNPVLWFAFRRMQADRELATDALALAVAGEDQARPYGETILKLLGTLNHPDPVPSAVGILEDRTQMRDRMRRIAGYRRPSRWSVLAAVPVALLALVTLTDARTGGATGANAAEKATVPSPAGAGFVPVDLTKHIVTAWSTIKPGSSWDAVPKGRQTLGDVPFEIAGLVEVAGTGGLQYNRDHPTRANAIRVGRKVAALHALHGAGFAVPDGTAIARLVLHYANGQSRELPIRYGEHVRNWWLEPNGESTTLRDAQTRVGWTGSSQETDAFKVTLRLFHTRFANPLPDQVLESVDLISTLSRCSEVLLGLTAEEPGAPVPPVFAAAAGTAAGPAPGEFFPVPLKAFCTRTYEVIDQDPDSSWAYAPHGRHVFNGVLFDLPGVMEVSGLGAARDDNPLPTSIRDIPLGRKARRLHLLHGGAADLRDGTLLAKLVLHYADGREHPLPIVYGVNVRNWYKGGDKRDDVSDPNTRLGWTGDSPRSRRFGSTLRIYHTAFDLPWPDVELKSVDFVSLLSESVSVVPAMTLETGGGSATPAPDPSLSNAPAGPVGTEIRVGEPRPPSLSDLPFAGPRARPASTEVRIRVLDAATGTPVEGATARLRATDGRREYNFGEQKATTRGELVLDVLNEGPTNRSVTVRAPGYMAVETTVPNPAQIPGRALTVRLKPGVRVSGRVTDTDNRPLAGATVQVRGITRDDAGQFVETLLETVTTDDAGRWTSGSVPPPAEGLSFQVAHPEFLPGEFEQAEDGAAAPGAPTGAALRAGNARFALERAPDVIGRVARADDDTPVANAEVVVATGADFVNRRFARTGVDGRFRVPVPELGPAQLLAQAPGFAPALTPIDVSPTTSASRVALPPARTLRGRVVDEAGKPVAGAWLYVARWKDVNLLTWRTETDADGRFLWEAAPREEFLLVADKTGFEQVHHRVPASAPGTEGPTGTVTETTVRLSRGFLVMGTAIDAGTRQPVEGISVLTSALYPGQDDEFPNWQNSSARTEAGGRFTLSMNKAHFGDLDAQVRVLVTAPGYLPGVSPAFDLASPHEFIFELKPGKGLEGIVQTADGTPVAGASVGLVGAGYLSMLPDGFRTAGRPGANLAQTSAEGRFSLPALVPAPRLIALHGTHGYAETTGDELARTGRIVLRPWGRIEGVLRLGSRPGTNQSVFLVPAMRQEMVSVQYDFAAYRTTTDARDGRFVITNVPPGERRLVRLVPMIDRGWTHSNPIQVEVKPGETTKLTWGGAGRPVVGRLVASATTTKIDWTSGHHSFTSRMPRRSFASGAEAAAWQRSPEAREYQRTMRFFAPEVAPDGSFRIEDVTPGEYGLNISLVDPESRSSGNWMPIGWANREVTVPAPVDGNNDQPLDLGEIQVQIQSPEALKAQREERERGQRGESPAAEASSVFQTLGHGELSFVDLREKLVLMVAWSTTNAAASSALLKEVESLRAAQNDPDRLAVLGILFDSDHPTAQGMIRDLGLKWPQLLPNASQRAAMLGALGGRPLPTTACQPAVDLEPVVGLRGQALKETVEKALKARTKPTEPASRP